MTAAAPKPRQSKTRQRGQRFHCPCQHESWVLTRRGAFHEFVGGDKKAVSLQAETRRYEGWTVLTGHCGAGIALQFKGAKVVESRDVMLEEMKRIRELPARRVDEFEEVLGGLKPERLERFRHIDTELDRRSADLVTAGVELGTLLKEAKEILGHRHFGLYLDRKGIDRTRATRSMEIAGLVAWNPKVLSTSKKLGYEKTALFARLPHAMRLQILDDGMPVDGRVVPLTEVSYRQLNAYRQSVLGKSTRGRKPRVKPSTDEPRDHYGLPAEFGEPIHHALGGLQALKVLAKKKRFAGLDPDKRLIAGRVWEQIWNLAYKLEHELGLGGLRGEDA